MYRSSPLRSTLNTGYITGLGMCKVKYVPKQFGHVYCRSTLNTGYITGLDMCKVCTEAVHCVALSKRTWVKKTQKHYRGFGPAGKNMSKAFVGIFMDLRTQLIALQTNK